MRGSAGETNPRLAYCQPGVFSCHCVVEKSMLEATLIEGYLNTIDRCGNSEYIC